MLDRDEELKVFFDRKDPLIPCHFFHPSCDCCSCEIGDNEKNCTNKGKHPVPRHGVFDAKPYSCAEEIGAWNVGLHCGNGLIVIDVDPRNGGIATLAKLEAEFGSLPQTWESVTGSGGRHIFFSGKQGQRSNMAFAAQGVEVKGYGSLVILPTSFHKSGHYYEWKISPDEVELAPVPEWILTVGKCDHVADSNGFSELYDVYDYIDCLSFLSPDCSRESWRNIAWGLQDAGIEFGVFDDWSKGSKKYAGVADCLRVWKSFKKGCGIGMGTVIYLARQAGWNPKPASNLVFKPTILSKIQSTTLEGGAEKASETTDEVDAIPAFEGGVQNAGPISKEAVPESTEKKKSTKKETQAALKSLHTSFDPSLCPDWPKGCVGQIAQRIYDTAPIKHKQFAIASALYIVSAIGSSNYVTPILDGSICIYVIAVAGAAVGKEHYRSVCERVVQKITPLKAMNEPLSSQALRFLWLDCNARSFVTDEALKWLGKIYDHRNQTGQMICSDILKVWSLGSKVLPGYSTKKKDDKTPDVDLPSLCIFGCGTEQQFEQRCKLDEFVSDGFLSRSDFIFAELKEANNHSPRRNKKFSLSPDIVEKLNKIAKEAVPQITVEFGSEATVKKPDMNVRKKVRYTSRQQIEWESESVAEMWDGIHDICKEKVAKNSRNFVYNSLWNRASEKTLRIASLLSIVEDAIKPCITKEILAWAWEWEKYVIDGMIANIGVNAGTETEILRARILRALKIETGDVRGATATFRNLVRHDSKIGKASNRDLQDAIDWLVRAGRIARTSMSNAGRTVEVLSLLESE